MSIEVTMKEKRLFYSPEKAFDLPIYAEQMATTFVDFGCLKPKHRKDTYASNVL